MNVVCKEIPLPLPLEELFARVCGRHGAFFLDSAQAAGRLGQWSFFGYEPFLSFRALGDRIVVRERSEERVWHGDALEQLRAVWSRYEAQGPAWLPFAGGAVGFVTYEFGAALERVKCERADDVGAPDMAFGFYEGIFAYEHATGRFLAVANPVAGEGAATILARLESGLDAAVREPAGLRGAGSSRVAPASLTASVSEPAYRAAISRIKDYIASGDVYQVNLAHRFSAPLRTHPYELYRRLRARSPAPFAAYLNDGDVQMLSSSPERFLRLREGRVETRPIKGTRPRGANASADAVLRDELATSEKDRAELLMIVDLERNDLGRVCRPGSVKVDELFTVETHPTVHHLVANVSGQLRAECDVFDCLRAALPGGSITGAPKVRAMQIIAELETTRRGVYTGVIGYIGFDGSCDFNIAIRTILCARGQAHYHVGGGIVWDSDPAAEYQETLDKGAAMRAALIDP